MTFLRVLLGRVLCARYHWHLKGVCLVCGDEES